MKNQLELIDAVPQHKSVHTHTQVSTSSTFDRPRHCRQQRGGAARIISQPENGTGLGTVMSFIILWLALLGVPALQVRSLPVVSDVALPEIHYVHQDDLLAAKEVGSLRPLHPFTLQNASDPHAKCDGALLYIVPSLDSSIHLSFFGKSSAAETNRTAIIAHILHARDDRGSSSEGPC